MKTYTAIAKETIATLKREFDINVSYSFCADDLGYYVYINDKFVAECQGMHDVSNLLSTFLMLARLQPKEGRQTYRLFAENLGDLFTQVDTFTVALGSIENISIAVGTYFDERDQYAIHVTIEAKPHTNLDWVAVNAVVNDFFRR